MSELINEKSPAHLVDALVDTFNNQSLTNISSLPQPSQSQTHSQSQWGEEGSNQSNIKQMSKFDIEETRQHLVSAYRCLSSDITFDFKKITDPNDEDKEDYIYLVYNKKDYQRPIFSIKVPIPLEIKTMAEQIRYEHSRQLV